MEWDAPTSWDDHSSDPIADIQRFIQQVYNERWICKGCAKTVMYEPVALTTRYPWYEVLACSDCGGTDWLHTYEDRVEL